MTLANTIFRVKKSPRIGRKPFQKGWDQLPHIEQPLVRLELMDQLGWSISTFGYKKRGDTPIREDEAPIIESIFEGFGLNAWTGERI